MSRGDTALLIIDVQGKLVRLINDHERIVWNCGRLIDAAKMLEMTVVRVNRDGLAKVRISGTVAQPKIR